MNESFVDHYSILLVEPDCDGKALEAAYHELAKKYHPDHTNAPDTLKLNEVLEAYRTLRDSERRAEYDEQYARHNGNSWSGNGFDAKAAIDDAEDHARILMFLYKRRREHPKDAGVIAFYIQEFLNCTYEEFDFHTWYLKEKGLIEVTEQGTIAITIEGIDHVISLARTTGAEKLMIGFSRRPQD
ncbi:MAG: DnaJ domain-containing protein [Sphingomicrobium sp.]